MAQLDSSIVAGQGGHITDHQVLAAKMNQVYDVVEDFGVVGDQSDEATGIQAAFDAARDDGGGTIAFPGGGRDYAAATTLTWHPGLRIVGGVGGLTGAWRPPNLKWIGASGGTLLEIDVADNIFNTELWYLSLTGDGSAGSTIVHQTNTTVGNWDTWSGFYHTQLSNAETGLKVEAQPTQVHMFHTRFDDLTTAVHVKKAKSCVISLDTIEWDNDSQTSGELLKLGFDGTDNNTFTNVQISNSRLESNGTMDGIVTIDTDDTTASYVRFLFSNLWVLGPFVAGNRYWINYTNDTPNFADATWINCSADDLTHLAGGGLSTPIASVGNGFEQVTILNGGSVTRL